MSAERALRQTLGSYATGVTVITARHPEDARDIGLTVNSFSSVSLSPPLVAWSIGRDSPHWKAFAVGATHFIHVLCADQAAIATRFATPNIDKFSGVETEEDRATNVKKLTRWAALMQCKTRSLTPAGDHYMVLAEVVTHAHQAAEPLLFVRGQFAAVTDLTSSVG